MICTHIPVFAVAVILVLPLFLPLLYAENAKTIHFYAFNGFQNNNGEQYAISYCVTTSSQQAVCDQTIFLSFGQHVTIAVPNAGNQLSYLIASVISSFNPAQPVASFSYPNNITDYNFFLAMYTSTFTTNANKQIVTNEPGLKGYGGALPSQHEIYVGYYDLYFNATGTSSDKVTSPVLDFYNLATGSLSYSVPTETYPLSFNKFIGLTFSAQQGNNDVDDEIYLQDGVVATTWCIANGNCQIQNAAIFCREQQLYANILAGNSYFNQMIVVSLSPPISLPSSSPTLLPTPSSQNNNDGSDLSDGGIVGISIMLMVIMVGVIYWIYRRCRKRYEGRLLVHDFSNV